MNDSKYQELVSLREQDHEATYAYLRKQTSFIARFRNDFVRYIGCDQQSVMFDKVPPGKHPGNGTRQVVDVLTVIPDGFLAFGLRLNLHTPDDHFPGFNINSCGQDFVEKGLAPPSGLIFGFASKHKEGDEYLLNILGNQNNLPDKGFTISSQEEEPFRPVFDVVYEEMKQILSLGMEGRVKRLTDRSAATNRGFGFVIPA